MLKTCRCLRLVSLFGSAQDKSALVNTICNCPNAGPKRRMPSPRRNTRGAPRRARYLTGEHNLDAITNAVYAQAVSNRGNTACFLLLVGVAEARIPRAGRPCREAQKGQAQDRSGSGGRRGSCRGRGGWRQRRRDQQRQGGVEPAGLAGLPHWLQPAAERALLDVRPQEAAAHAPAHGADQRVARHVVYIHRWRGEGLRAEHLAHAAGPREVHVAGLSRKESFDALAGAAP